jgi:F-type H+-transporting ATPase subunit c
MGEKQMSARIKNVAMTLALAIVPSVAHAQNEGGASGDALIGLAASLVVAIAALGGTLAQGKAVSSSVEAIGRNPGAAGELKTPMILGLVFIETLVIFSFVVALQLIGKL